MPRAEVRMSPGVALHTIYPTATGGWNIVGQHAATGCKQTWSGEFDDTATPYAVALALYELMMWRYGEAYTHEQAEALETEIVLALAPLLALA